MMVLNGSGTARSDPEASASAPELKEQMEVGKGLREYRSVMILLELLGGSWGGTRPLIGPIE